MFAVSSHSPWSKLCAAKLLVTITSSDQAGTAEILRANIVNATGEAQLSLNPGTCSTPPSSQLPAHLCARIRFLTRDRWCTQTECCLASGSEEPILWNVHILMRWGGVGFVFNIVISNLGPPWTVITEVTSLVSEAIPCIISVAVVAGVRATSSK